MNITTSVQACVTFFSRRRAAGAEKDRELRYTFARAAGARQLLVTTQFAERGRGQIIKRVYD